MVKLDGAFGFVGTVAVAGFENTDSLPAESTVVAAYVYEDPATTVLSVKEVPVITERFNRVNVVAGTPER
jgi:hypothetical protein